MKKNVVCLFSKKKKKKKGYRRFWTVNFSITITTLNFVFFNILCFSLLRLFLIEHEKKNFISPVFFCLTIQLLIIFIDIHPTALIRNRFFPFFFLTFSSSSSSSPLSPISFLTNVLIHRFLQWKKKKKFITAICCCFLILKAERRNLVLFLRYICIYISSNQFQYTYTYTYIYVFV